MKWDKDEQLMYLEPGDSFYVTEAVATITEEETEDGYGYTLMTSYNAEYEFRDDSEPGYYRVVEQCEKTSPNYGKRYAEDYPAPEEGA